MLRFHNVMYFLRTAAPCTSSHSRQPPHARGHVDCIASHLPRSRAYAQRPILPGSGHGASGQHWASSKLNNDEASIIFATKRDAETINKRLRLKPSYEDGPTLSYLQTSEGGF